MISISHAKEDLLLAQTAVALNSKFPLSEWTTCHYNTQTESPTEGYQFLSPCGEILKKLELICALNNPDSKGIEPQACAFFVANKEHLFFSKKAVHLEGGDEKVICLNKSEASGIATVIGHKTAGICSHLPDHEIWIGAVTFPRGIEVVADVQIRAKPDFKQKSKNQSSMLTSVLSGALLGKASNDVLKIGLLEMF